jgi:hypothetical protein
MRPERSQGMQALFAPANKFQLFSNASPPEGTQRCR